MAMRASLHRARARIYAQDRTHNLADDDYDAIVATCCGWTKLLTVLWPPRRRGANDYDILPVVVVDKVKDDAVVDEAKDDTSDVTSPRSILSTSFVDAPIPKTELPTAYQGRTWPPPERPIVARLPMRDCSPLHFHTMSEWQ